MSAMGCQSMFAPIRRLLLKHARDAFLSQEAINRQWQKLHYPEAPVFEEAVAEYQGFVELLSQLDIELLYLPPDSSTTLDSIYVHDPLLFPRGGAILCGMGKEARQSEPRVIAARLEELGIPLLGRIRGEGRLEGGDVVWLDERTAAVGQGYRTNAEGIRQFRDLLGDRVDEVLPVPLPHWKGPSDVFHLMSIISPLDRDLALVHSPLMPVPFRQLLLERGMKLIEVDPGEYDSLGCNVLAVRPRLCLMVEGNPRTREHLEAEGVEVLTFPARNIALLGAGGPTCLTRPLHRSFEN